MPPPLISDNRKLEGVSEHDQLWLRETWLPLAVTAGITHIAVVVPHRGLGRIATDAIISKFGNTAFETRTFESLTDPTPWVSEH